MTGVLTTVAGTGRPRRLAVPDVIARFRDYHRAPGNGVWGSLHVVLDDMNVRDHDVRWAIEHAESKGDGKGVALGHILLGLTTTQRLRMAHRA